MYTVSFKIKPTINIIIGNFKYMYGFFGKKTRHFHICNVIQGKGCENFIVKAHTTNLSVFCLGAICFFFKFEHQSLGCTVPYIAVVAYTQAFT